MTVAALSSAPNQRAALADSPASAFQRSKISRSVATHFSLELYGERFEKILFLHPLDEQARGWDVHVTYGGGYSFNSMIAGARDRISSYFSGFDVVLFAHNDLLLNPAVRGDTFAAEYGVDRDPQNCGRPRLVGGPAFPGKDDRFPG